MELALQGASKWERSFKEMFDLSLDLLCIGGLDGYFKRVNPAFERVFGYSSAELVSRPFRDFVHPQDQAAAQDAFERLDRGEEVTTLENRIICADGSTRWLEWTARPVLTERIFYGAGRDVTERKQAEERLRQAQETLEASGDELRTHVEEQAALRRVATLVAQGVPATELLDAVAVELERLFGADLAALLRYDADGDATILAANGEMAASLKPGMRASLVGDSIAASVLRTGRPVAIARYADASGEWAERMRELGVRSAVGAPITVEGRLWGGVAAAWTEPQPLTAGDAQTRIGNFAELVATAIANAEGREELRERSDQQAALRRVATLVARGVSPDELYAAVAEEAGRLLDADLTMVLRYEDASAVTVLAGFGEQRGFPRPGTRLALEGDSISARVLRTGCPSRIESYAGARGDVADVARDAGIRASVGAPIIVEGRLWGLAAASWGYDGTPAPDIEHRLAAFTELIATAVANAESRAELTASRARVVAAADATRQRIERDLHDGAQQQLVALALEVRAAEASVPSELGELRAELSCVAERLTGVVDELREIAHGIHPAVLSQGGLGPALRTLARRSAIPVQLDIRTEHELAQQVEVAAYYVVSEALTNAAKHAHASVVDVELESQGGMLCVTVRDDGVGGADPRRGSGLLGLKDRAEALGGRLALDSVRGGGTSLCCELPLAATVERLADGG